MALLTGVLLAVALTGANEGQRDERPLALVEADALCISHRANPESVLAAADRAGWTNPMAVAALPGGLLGQLGMSASRQVRTKFFGDDQLILTVHELNDPAKDGTLRSFKCSIHDVGQGSKRIGSALRLRFRVAPSQSDEKHWLWVYRDSLGDGPLLPASRAAQYRTLLAGHRIVAIAAVQSDHEPAVLYSETVLVRR